MTPSAGRLTAENLDLRLQLVETRERLAALWADRKPVPTIRPHNARERKRDVDPLEDQRNRRVLIDYLEMSKAIKSSLPWRLLQIPKVLLNRSLDNPVAMVTTADIESLEDPAEVRRLLDVTSEYVARVFASREWRALQKFRDFFGRRW